MTGKRQPGVDHRTVQPVESTPRILSGKATWERRPAAIARPSRRGAAPTETARLDRVAAGAYAPAAPTDPDVRDYRIRLLD
ncbi:hypothetical protein CKO23_21355 [Thiocystis violacea]|nr:hypothetical protein [Thiocystis violacea]